MRWCVMITDADGSLCGAQPDPSKAGQFADRIRSYWPQVSESDLSADYCGIRPKINVRGSIYEDFYFAVGQVRKWTTLSCSTMYYSIVGISILTQDRLRALRRTHPSTAFRDLCTCAASSRPD